MASTYSTNLAIELIGTGDQAGAWGNTTNTNLGTLIEQAISGYVTQAVATGTDTTITIPNGATGVARNMYIELTGTGGASTNLIVPANKKLYFIYNNTTGAVTVKVAGQTGVSVPQNAKLLLVSNGTDVVPATSYVTSGGAISFDSLVVTNLAATSATITTLNGTSATISSALTLSGGTANGVLYLNGSKVATSGSALTFSGTTLVNTGPLKVGDGAASNTSRLMVNNATNTATGIQLFQDGIESWIMGMPANSAGLAWSASGAEQMRLTSIGLGIGTSSPTAKLDVAGTFNGTQAVFAYTSGRGLLIGTALSGGTNEGMAILNARGSGEGLLALQTDSVERARVTNTGNFLVGTTTDVSGRSGVISDVAGNVRAIPRTGSAKTSVYTLAITDVGQFVELGTGGGIDVPNGVFSTGDVVSVFNNTTGARTISLTITTAYIGGTDADKASVTLATRGVATILFISNSVCVLSGNVS